ncbi:MAG: hypothetical protein ACK4NU_06875 [Brevundimonas sp.]
MRRIGYVPSGWATGLIILFANFIVLIGLRLVMVRVLLFDDVTPPVLLWWRDWTMLNIPLAWGFCRQLSLAWRHVGDRAPRRCCLDSLRSL